MEDLQPRLYSFGDLPNTVHFWLLPLFLVHFPSQTIGFPVAYTVRPV